jgi:hypothetical protein
VLDATGKIYKGLEIGIPAVQKSQESGPFSEKAIKDSIFGPEPSEQKNK